MAQWKKRDQSHVSLDAQSTWALSNSSAGLRVLPPTGPNGRLQSNYAFARAGLNIKRINGNVLASGWVVAQPNDSCTDTCASRQPCNIAAIKAVNTAAIFKSIATRLGMTKPCTANFSAGPSYSPAFDHLGGPCLFNTVNSGCMSKTTSRPGFRRLCCCATSASSCPLN